MDKILPRTQLDVSGKMDERNADSHESDFESCLNCEGDTKTKFEKSDDKSESSSSEKRFRLKKNEKGSSEATTKHMPVDLPAFSVEQIPQNWNSSDDGGPSFSFSGLSQASFGTVSVEQEDKFVPHGFKASVIRMNEWNAPRDGQTETRRPFSSGMANLGEGMFEKTNLREMEAELAELRHRVDQSLDSYGKQTHSEIKDTSEANSAIERELKGQIVPNDKSIEADGEIGELALVMSEAYESEHGQEGFSTQQDLGRRHEQGSGIDLDSTLIKDGVHIDFMSVLKQGAPEFTRFDNDRLIDSIEPPGINPGFSNSQVAETSKLVISQLIEPLSGMEFSDLQGGDRHLSIQIYPAEWGHLEVRVTGSEDGMVAEIFATEYITSELLNREKTQLIEALNEKGLHFPSFDISHRESNDQSSAGSKYEDSNEWPKPLESEKLPPKTTSKHTSSKSLIDLLV